MEKKTNESREENVKQPVNTLEQRVANLEKGIETIVKTLQATPPTQAGQQPIDPQQAMMLMQMLGGGKEEMGTNFWKEMGLRYFGLLDKVALRQIGGKIVKKHK